MSSVWAAHKGKIVAAAGLSGALLFSLVGSPLTSASVPRTIGVGNIEDRFSSGGGSKDHTPGQASPRGSVENVQGNTVRDGTDSNKRRQGELRQDQREGQGTTNVSTRTTKDKS